MIKSSLPILVTGCSRSGMSMIQGILQISGAFCGTMSGRNETRGLLENDKLNEFVCKYFESIGADIRGQYPLPHLSSLPIPSDWKDSVMNRLRSEGYLNSFSWSFKSSKSCLIWPVWNYAFPNARWIIVRRRTGDILRSCMSTDFMNAFQNAGNQSAVLVPNEKAGWLWWIHQFEKRFIEMISTGLNCYTIWPERIVHGDYQQLFELLDWLHLPLKLSQVLPYIDPKMYKARENDSFRYKINEMEVPCGTDNSCGSEGNN